MRAIECASLLIYITFNLAIAGCSNQASSPTPGIIPKSEGSTLPIEEIWCQNINQVISYPVFYKGLIYTIQRMDWDSTMAAEIVVFNPSGSVVWKRSVEFEGYTGYWFVKEGYFVAGSTSSVTILDALSGEVIVPDKDIWDQVMSTNRGMTVGNGRIYLGSDNALKAFSLKDGKLLWEIPGTGRMSFHSVYYIYASDLLLLDVSPYRVVNAGTGEIIFETGQTYENGDPPHLGEGIIYKDKYIRVMNNGLEVLDIMTAKRAAFLEGGFEPLSQYPFLKDGKVYLNAYYAIEVVDIENSKRVWRHLFSRDFQDDGLKVYGGPVEFNGNVYVILSDATIHALDSNTGKDIGSWQGHGVEKLWGIGTNQIPGFAVGDDRLYVSFGTNELCAFGNN